MKVPSWVVPAVLAALCFGVAGYLELGPRQVASSRRAGSEGSLSPQARVLLGDMAVGDSMAGWKVLGMRGPTHEEIQIDFGREQMRFTLSIARLGAKTEGAPLQTERFALYYGHAHPAGVTIPNGAIRALLHGVGRQLRATERSVELPEGL